MIYDTNDEGACIRRAERRFDHVRKPCLHRGRARCPWGPTAHILSLILELEFPKPAANFRPSLRYPLSASSRCGLFSWLWDRRVVFPTPRPAAHQARRVGPKHTA